MHAPTKITLKNQTKMTLNDRFTAIMKSSKNLTPHHSHQAESSQRPASEKNRRLAQQMEKRTYTGSIEQRPTPSVSKPSVLERLGQRRGGVIPHVSVARGNNRGRREIFRGGVQKAFGNGRGGHFTGRFNSRRGIRGGFRGGLRGRGGRGRGSSTKSLSKDELDQALDSYMSHKANTEA